MSETFDWIEDDYKHLCIRNNLYNMGSDAQIINDLTENNDNSHSFSREGNVNTEVDLGDNMDEVEISF